jgi:alpha-D-ribose 1-methylphosphonate 5-triphosphate synthase subunit PhnL
MSTVLELAAVSKTFRMHLQGGIRLPVVSGVAFDVKAGECAVLAGPSGAGKSSILKMIFGTYRCDSGSIVVRHGGDAVDVATAEPRQILELRRTALGYVSQFLRAVPRVAAIDVVAEPLVIAGVARMEARQKAADLLSRLNIPERLWPLPPATFSGGEQQRVNIARGFVSGLPLLLLDEPTASLDAGNRAVVVDLVAEKKRSGTAVVAIVHDQDVRTAIADTVVEVARFTPTAAERS